MALIPRFHLLMQRSIAVVYTGVFILLQGCAPVQSLMPKDAVGPTANVPAGFFVPSGVFSASASGPLQPSGSVATSTAMDTSAVPSPSRAAMVFLYASPATNAYFARGGLDAKVNIQLWEVFLRKYQIPFQVLTSVDLLEGVPPGVLLLPSSVALSEREKRAVIGFRAKGGGVLASWLTGVRNENGEWRGFDFMESALDVKVVGDTQADKDDNFMMPYGDSPVTHSLPAGLRIWLERVGEWHPLRMIGEHTAAQMMDWSRTVVPNKPGAAVVFDERQQSSGIFSRSVVLGYPERLWLSADPELLEAIAHNALMWLLRQPDAYISAWPYPYTSAFVLAVDSADIVDETDLRFANKVEDSGGRATYYALTENAAKSAEILNKIQARGHEIAYLGDRFVGFQSQSAAEQAKRLDAMRDEMKSAGVDVAMNAGFRAPMESSDRITEHLLIERGFDHYASFMDGTDARLPFFVTGDADTRKPAKSLVVLPRTQGGPEDSADDGGTNGFLKTYLAELDLAEQMAALSVIRIPNQSALGAEELALFFKDVKARKDRMWMATAGQTANWWRERQRVSIRLEPGAVAMQLSVTIVGDTPLKQPVAVWINLPEFGSTLRLIHRGSKAVSPKIMRVDAWRAAVVLEGLSSGEYRWNLYFDHPTATEVR